MTVSGAVLILFVVLLRMIAVKRLPKDTFLILWGIVLIRLLVPVSVPSAYSVYGLADWSAVWEADAEKGNDAFGCGMLADMSGREALLPWRALDSGLPLSEEADVTTWEQIDGGARKETDAEAQRYAGGTKYGKIALVLFIGWIAGAFTLLVFFIMAYLCGLLRFRTSLPVREANVEKWLREHPLKRSISVRQSDKITAPLTYGFWHPVILVPKKTDWSDTVKLEYILLHEYVHIRRFDIVSKLIAVLALCIHWFNPFVWLMYVLFNRDMELACDEKVVRRFGEMGKAGYARTLIAMGAEQSGLVAFGNHFGRNAVEERIVAIMKWRKASLFRKMLSAVLVIGVASVYAVSTLTIKVNAENADTLSGVAQLRDGAVLLDADFTEEEYEELLALQFDGYEEMSVAQYQEKVWAYTDTVPYRTLLERFSQSETLYASRNDNETAAFLFYILEPLTAERWQERGFGGSVSATGSPAPSENGILDIALLEYEITFSLKKPYVLTVRAYDDARKGMMDGLADFLQHCTKEQLQDETYMEEAILTQIGVLKQKWSTEALEIWVEYAYMPLTLEAEEDISGEQPLTTDEYYRNVAELENQPETKGEERAEEEWKEPRINEYATEEDYRSLFTLQTAGYQQLSVADFNEALLDWGNANFDAYERIREDYYRNDYQVELSDEELFFIGITMEFSGEENYRRIQSLRTGRPEEAPGYRSYLMEKEAADGITWCGFEYEFTYRLSDQNAVTVAARDGQLSGVLREINCFWEETSLEELLRMTKADVLQKLNEIAVKYSNDWIEITIDEECLYFEGMDERASGTE